MPVAEEAVAAEAPKLVLETRGFTSGVNGIDFSTDGRRLAVAGADKVLRVWDLETGQLRSTLRGQDGIGGIGVCTAVAYAPRGRELVVGVKDFNLEGNIRVYRASEPEEIAELLPGHPQGGVAELTFSGDGEYLASVGSDRRSIIIWQWATRRPLHRLATPRAVRYIGFPVKGLPVLATIDVQAPVLWSAAHGKSVTELAPAQLLEEHVVPDPVHGSRPQRWTWGTTVSRQVSKRSCRWPRRTRSPCTRVTGACDVTGSQGPAAP